jgi:hypothetical protein
MNPFTDSVPIPTSAQSNPFRGKALKGCLAIAIIALIPHFGKSYTITDGLKLGINASTNTASVDYNWGSIAAGSYNSITGYYQYALGSSNTITGSGSAAIGSNHTVSGSNSFTYGSTNQTASSALYSMAGGSNTLANGRNSVALGYYTTAPSYASVVLGRYNQVASGQTTSSWVASDQLFVIGNGTSGSPSNALEVKKDGVVTIPNKLILTNSTPAGDIPMYAPQ